MRTALSTALTLLLATAIVLHAHCARAGDAPHWPDTRAGALARGWVAAFDAGADSMRTFYARNLATRSLAGRDMTTRLARYAELHETYGTLRLLAVEESDGAHVRAKIVDGDARTHTFEFRLEAAAPYKLEQVAIYDAVDHMHGFLGGFHH